MKEYHEIKEQIQRMAMEIDAPKELLPSYGSLRADADSYVEIRGTIYHYVTTDYGREVNRRTTIDLDNLLYWVFSNITFQMAVLYEKEHRSPKTDFRRILFSYQLELLNRVNPQWKESRAKEIDYILEAHPFNDNVDES